MKNNKWYKILTATLLVAGALLIVFVLLATVFGKESVTADTDFIKKDKYQAVFLNTSDGQVYFGKLSSINQNFYKLTDIYYVRVQQVQPSDAQQQAQQQISLAKLGSEIHGPEDAMFINKKEVIFWENLKDDGQVVKAIKDYKKNGDQSTTNTNSTTNSNTTNNNSTTNNSNNTTTNP